MSRTYVQILGFVLPLLCIGCTASRPPGAVAMTCSSASYHTYSGTVAGRSGRTICNEVKSPDGRTAVVRIRDTREGEKVYCTEKEGKLTCPDVPLATFAIPQPGVVAGAPGFVFPPIPPAVTSSPLIRR